MLFEKQTGARAQDLQEYYQRQALTQIIPKNCPKELPKEPECISELFIHLDLSRESRMKMPQPSSGFGFHFAAPGRRCQPSPAPAQPLEHRHTGTAWKGSEYKFPQQSNKKAITVTVMFSFWDKAGELKKTNQTQTETPSVTTPNKTPSVTTPNNSTMVCAYPKVYQGFGGRATWIIWPSLPQS